MRRRPRRAVELAFLEDVLDVPGDDGLVALEQLGHLTERQPGRLAIEANLDPRLAVLGLVEEELGFASGELGHRARELSPLWASRDASLAMTSHSRASMQVPSRMGLSCSAESTFSRVALSAIRNPRWVA